MRNTIRFDFKDGVTHGDWALYSGLFVGSQIIDTEIGAYIKVPADPDKIEGFAGVNLPGNMKLGVSTQEELNAQLSFGVSQYFGFGGGIAVGLDLIEFYTRLVVNPLLELLFE